MLYCKSKTIYTMTYNIPKQKAIQLRKNGYSYNYISEKLGLAKSTLSYWFRDIPYIPNEEVIRRIGEGKLKMAITKSRQKMESTLKAKEKAKEDVGVLTKRDLFMIGIGLYMGEGSKTTGSIRIINSDPQILQFAVQWFKKICDLRDENFSLAVHLYPDNEIEKSLMFWSKTLNIPKNQFGKTQVDKRTGKKAFKRGRLPYGTAHLTIRSNNNSEFGIFLFRKIMAWIDIVIKQAGVV